MASQYKCILFSSAYLVFLFFATVGALQVAYDSRALKLDGERKLIISGSIHYPRSTPEMWPDLVKNAKEGGLNAIETYIFWNAHEPLYRQYNFEGNLDFVRFFKTIQNEGLYAILRIGPYVCAEWDYGGFPMWLHNMPGIKLRTNNEVYKKEMQTFTTLIVDMAKNASLFASQGGPIILAQIENEYGNIYDKYGEEGKEYIKWAAQMAVNQKISEPWIMCQQSDAPPPMINTCNGYYCDSFTPTRNDVPKMFTENWSGWFKQWGQRNPHRTAEDLAYSVARFFQKGGALMNYYMYHGGTDFGRTAGPMMATTYDYDAPLDEYGNLNQPKWGHLKQLHDTILSVEKILTHGDVRTENLTATVEATIYSLGGNSTCFITNVDEKNDATVSFQAKTYFVPAWSVSILPDCNQETYNTAKVNVQTTVLAQKSEDYNLDQEPERLQWSWRSEGFRHLKNPDSLTDAIKANKLMDQKEVANDTSDYLWYMTSVTLNDGDALLGKPVYLQVNTSGHILHAFVNEKYVGSKDGWAFKFEQPINLVKGVNKIALLSVTVGFPNYGAFFDLEAHGVTGPVVLSSNASSTTITKDLSNNQWTYKVGIEGEQRKFFTGQIARRQWRNQELIFNRRFTWYKATFKTPVGTNPVVLDFNGLNKGHAWVNGNSIGRYWVSKLAPTEGCSSTCDYRGKYYAEKCNTGCGKPTQRWYHVPRSFLSDSGENTLILFEEFGGNPSFVGPQTVRQTKACAYAYEGSNLSLSCQQGRSISEIKFASFGDPQGECGQFKKGTCESTNALATISSACVGKPSCDFAVTEQVLGPTGCTTTPRRLAVEALCN
ncbi:hypothetical protein Cgig2_028390 [Carnegiea gigantea]|uniref:Beta-galactosidase n=1 Tax=Carnegiea gigantea TaxID=171969 RepID=A0A9Q1K2A1_9CARY|nr:hypothetical protein Cgig2_028390 [Carnegiea gigantea]